MQRNATQRQKSLARLKAALQKAGITQKRVATMAGVGVPTVCNVLAGRAVSANVVTTAKRLLADRQNGAETLAEPRSTREILETERLSQG